jgi:glyoxylase-like metal-dependent hydrolase (beta-lactamase superfamily II)
MTNRLEIETIVSAPFEENSYIAWLPGGKKCVVVDPGFEPEAILDRMKEESLDLEAILLTHGHADHIAGVATMKEAFPSAPIIIGAGDAGMLSDPYQNLSALGGMKVTSPPADHLVREGEPLELLGLEWDVLEIPGHSLGHVVFVWKGGTPPIVFGGDVLFRGSIGRFDFPGGDGRKLIDGIRTKLFTLPEETRIYAGHGEMTTVGHEKRTNPFAREGASLF